MATKELFFIQKVVAKNGSTKTKKEDPKLNLHGISFVDSQLGWVIGTKGTEAWTGVILYTRDSGKHWQTQYELSKDAALQGISFTDKNQDG